MDYRVVGLDEMAAFMRWLQNPYNNLKVTPISPVTSARAPQTINIVLSTVIGLYDYLMRHEDYNVQLSEKLKMQISGSHRGFKNFLYHINKSRSYDAKILMLRLKVPKQRPKTISKEKVIMLLDSCLLYP